MALKLKSTSDLLSFGHFQQKPETAGRQMIMKKGYEDMSIKKKRAPAPLTISCPVCGGPAPDHIHFGGQSCYSCRAFFRRTSVKPHSKFRCRTGKHDCKISTGVKSCISCRLQRCLKIGMDPNLVRGKKCKKEEDLNSDDMLEKFEKEEEAIDEDYNESNLSKVTPSPDPEELLKYRAGLLQYQGSWLQFQASILEQRARQARAEVNYVPTICHSNSSSFRTPDTSYSHYPSSYNLDHDNLMEDHFEEEEAPLDLTIKRDPSLRHTQSQAMPRIFFSLATKSQCF